MQNYDVIILGGGLAGQCLGRQLILNNQKLNILIIERNKFPVQESAHKVGESTVELGSYYLSSVLGLEQHLKDSHLPKAGLRFFFTNGNNQQLSSRYELGSTAFPPAPSYQLDRGRLENHLCDENRKLGIEIRDNCSVKNCHFDKIHTVTIEKNKQISNITTRWLIDATGRFSLIKRKKNLKKQNNHNVNASWFRLKTRINIDDWLPKASSHTYVPKNLRYFSTNHLMGHGYWLWIIPLASGSTSIGVVADNRPHPFDTIKTFPQLIKWMAKYEPQCGDTVYDLKDELQDFHTLRNYSYGCSEIFSPQRWCLTGEAGVFLDPLYSPGTDFIAINNTMISHLIHAEYMGEDINILTKRFQNLYLQLYQNSLSIYQDQYLIMGNHELMIRKIIWDYAVYWGFTALLFTHNKLCDFSFMKEIKNDLQKLDTINYKIQNCFNKAHKLKLPPIKNSFINTLTLPELGCYQAELLASFTNTELKSKLKDNLGDIIKYAKQLF